MSNIVVKRKVVEALTLVGLLVAQLITAGNLLASDNLIHPDAQGRWFLPLRYWAHQQPFNDIDGIIFLAEVTSLGPEISRPKVVTGPFQFRKGDLKVIEVLSPPIKTLPALAKIKSLQVEGTEGLHLGDRVVVLVCPEPYEGSYVINYHEGGCILGVRLPAKDDFYFDDTKQELFLGLLRAGKNDVRTLKPEEMRIWLQVDAPGLGAALIREIEMERLRWHVAQLKR